MGTEEVQQDGASSKEDEVISPTYSIVKYKGSELPKNYTGLIYAKWLRSLRFGNPLFKEVLSSEFYDHYHQYIENLMNKPDSEVRLAVLTDDKDVVLGFAVSREDVLDYVHVTKDYRNHGIGKSLLPPKITTFSHITTTAMDIWRRKPSYRHLKFNPFA